MVISVASGLVCQRVTVGNLSTFPLVDKPGNGQLHVFWMVSIGFPIRYSDSHHKAWEISSNHDAHGDRGSAVGAVGTGRIHGDFSARTFWPRVEPGDHFLTTRFCW